MKKFVLNVLKGCIGGLLAGAITCSVWALIDYNGFCLNDSATVPCSRWEFAHPFTILGGIAGVIGGVTVGVLIGLREGLVEWLRRRRT
jgi:hypothetical protein